jgi:hypothetical protein
VQGWQSCVCSGTTVLEAVPVVWAAGWDETRTAGVGSHGSEWCPPAYPAPGHPVCVCVCARHLVDLNHSEDAQAAGVSLVSCAWLNSEQGQAGSTRPG